jgi:pimeloyl-ACP methyl ester carboxylesterase
MSTTKVDTLRVPGARLYYEVRGAGSVLLLIAGGAGDAESFNLLADHLVDHYSVLTYDRRGLARSPLDDLDQAIEIEALERCTW